jgi:hypothetical protein
MDTSTTKDPPRRGSADGSERKRNCSALDNPQFIGPSAATRALNQLRRRRLVEHLHSLGPSPLGHFIREVEDAARVDVTPRLERYAEIDPEFVRALGGDKFPPRFLHALEG